MDCCNSLPEMILTNPSTLDQRYLSRIGCTLYESHRHQIVCIYRYIQRRRGSQGILHRENGSVQTTANPASNGLPIFSEAILWALMEPKRLQPNGEKFEGGGVSDCFLTTYSNLYQRNLGTGSRMKLSRQVLLAAMSSRILGYLPSSSFSSDPELNNVDMQKRCQEKI